MRLGGVIKSQKKVCPFLESIEKWYQITMPYLYGKLLIYVIPSLYMYDNISVDELWFIKKCQNCTFKVNFQCQKSTEFSQKKLRLRPNILAKRLGGRSLSRLMKNFGLGLLTD